MAKPEKNNAEYFSHDSCMRNDPKVKALRRKFRHEGYSAYCMILELLTDSANFEYDFNDINTEIIAGDFDLEPNNLQEIIAYSCHIGLFIREGTVIFSLGLKHRLKSVIDKRNNAKARYLSQKEQKSIESVTDTTQSKVKERKVNERRDYTREEFFKSVLEFFGFSEISNFSNYKLLTEFCHALAGSDRLDNFKNQFENYRQLKLMAGFKHSFIKFLGKQDEKFEDGAWCSENWEQKLKEEIQIRASKNGNTAPVIQARPKKIDHKNLPI